MMRFRSLPARDTGSEAYAAPLSFHGRGSAAGGMLPPPRLATVRADHRPGFG